MMTVSLHYYVFVFFVVYIVIAQTGSNIAHGEYLDALRTKLTFVFLSNQLKGAGIDVQLI